MSELITATEAAPLLGVASGRVARQTLARRGIRPVGRAPGRGGESLYRRADVEYTVAHPPRRGRPPKLTS